MDKRFSDSLPLEDFERQVGVIVGCSSSGKTSIIKQVFPEVYLRGFDCGSECVLDPSVFILFFLFLTEAHVCACFLIYDS